MKELGEDYMAPYSEGYEENEDSQVNDKEDIDAFESEER